MTMARGAAFSVHIGSHTRDDTIRAGPNKQVAGPHTRSADRWGYALRFFPPQAKASKGFGVSDGIRTRDVQIHSLALYQAELRSPQEG